MAFDRRRSPRRAAVRALASGVGGWILVGTGAAQGLPPPGVPAPGQAIYLCTTANGQSITADRFIAACADREQRVLNKDGSLRMIVPPSMSPAERAAQMVREHQAEQARAAEAEQRRRDRDLLRRYPTESAHQAAREAELRLPMERLKAAEAQRESILKEARPLRDEAEFYRRPGTMPADLKAKLDGVEASLRAVNATLLALRSDVDRVDQRYDEELRRLQPMWASLPPPR